MSVLSFEFDGESLPAPTPNRDETQNETYTPVSINNYTDHSVSCTLNTDALNGKTATLQMVITNSSDPESAVVGTCEYTSTVIDDEIAFNIDLSDTAWFDFMVGATDKFVSFYITVDDIDLIPDKLHDNTIITKAQIDPTPAISTSSFNTADFVAGYTDVNFTYSIDITGKTMSLVDVTATGEVVTGSEIVPNISNRGIKSELKSGEKSEPSDEKSLEKSLEKGSEEKGEINEQGEQSDDLNDGGLSELIPTTEYKVVAKRGRKSRTESIDFSDNFTLTTNTDVRFTYYPDRIEGINITARCVITDGEDIHIPITWTIHKDMFTIDNTDYYYNIQYLRYPKHPKMWFGYNDVTNNAIGTTPSVTSRPTVHDVYANFTVVVAKSDGTTYRLKTNSFCDTINLYTKQMLAKCSSGSVYGNTTSTEDIYSSFSINTNTNSYYYQYMNTLSSLPIYLTRYTNTTADRTTSVNKAVEYVELYTDLDGTPATTGDINVNFTMYWLGDITKPISFNYSATGVEMPIATQGDYWVNKKDDTNKALYTNSVINYRLNSFSGGVNYRVKKQYLQAPLTDDDCTLNSAPWNAVTDIGLGVTITSDPQAYIQSTQDVPSTIVQGDKYSISNIHIIAVSEYNGGFTTDYGHLVTGVCATISSVSGSFNDPTT